MTQMMMKSRFDVGSYVAVVIDGELQDKLFIVDTVRFCANAGEAYVEYIVNPPKNLSYKPTLREDSLYSGTQVQALQAELEDAFENASKDFEHTLPGVIRRIAETVSKLEKLRKQFSEVINAKAS